MTTLSPSQMQHQLWLVYLWIWLREPPSWVILTALYTVIVAGMVLACWKAVEIVNWIWKRRNKT